MSNYAEEKRDLDYVADMIAKCGDFPPPWIYAENSHPYSIQWRMGSGASYIMAFGEWWEQEGKSFDDRIAYFRRWSPPPRWCGWMADAIWGLEPWEDEDEFDYAEYFSELKTLGFEGMDDYETDLDNENYD